jgi:uncharacterized protein
VQFLDGQLILSSQDLVAGFECQHKLHLNLAAKLDLIDKPTEKDPALEIIAKLGIEHEQRILSELKNSTQVIELGMPEYSIEGYRNAWLETKKYIDQEVEVIYQATLFNEDFIGFVDFLQIAKSKNGQVLRDDLGKAIYEPVDTKSARSAKKSAVIQVGAYCESLQRLGQPTPVNGRLWLGNDEKWAGSSRRLIPLASELRKRTLDFVNSNEQLPEKSWAHPVAACTNCAWKKHCETGRSQDRDLSLVQGIYGATRQKLFNSGITTIDLLAQLSADDCPTEVSRITFEKLVEQAKIQVLSEETGNIETRLKPEHVLSHFPQRSEGDIWFDMEGDPYANSGRGLEYMFGVGFLNNDKFDFRTFEGHDVFSEKKAFEDFIDYLIDRMDKYEDLHIYHYASYEKTAITNLASKYATREDEVNRILKEGRLVDLYNIVRNSFRISTPSLSIKDVEHIYRPEKRNKDGVTNAMDSVIQYEAFLGLLEDGENTQANAILTDIRNYNRDDCESTYQLDTWIREQINANGIKSLAPIVAPISLNESISKVISESLIDGIPVDPKERTELEQGLANVSAAVLYHNREARPFWWNVFELARCSKEELEIASDAVAFDKAKAESWGIEGRQTVYRRLVKIECSAVDFRDQFEIGGPVHLIYANGQEGMLNLSDAPGGFSNGKLLEIKSGKFGIIEEYHGTEGQRWNALPIGMTAGRAVNDKPLEDQLAQMGATVDLLKKSNQDFFPPSAWTDILLRRKPRQISSEDLPQDETAHQSITKALLDSDNSYIAVQGPPGTGKTYTGSKVVAQLVSQGWKVGVVAQSHAVVEQFMDKVREENSTTPMAKKPKGPATLPYHRDKIDEWASGQIGGYVIGGTAWTFVGQKIQALDLDLLVIDEAGQFSLANTLAVASTVKRVLLLGDPQQLPQVSQGAHPEPVDNAALAHLLDGQATIPQEFGYFLENSFRMHSEVSKKVSNLQYDGKLHSDESANQRKLDDITPGVQTVVVQHTANRTTSVEEAEAVVSLIDGLMGKRWFKDLNRLPKTINQEDFIVVAPYNAQVRLIRRILRANGYEDIQVGTVDKFQGREAVISIVSMATSSDENLPRGIDFLLSPNRLNVAISRAKWAAFVVHSPELRRINPASINGLLNLGGFLGLLEK